MAPKISCPTNLKEIIWHGINDCEPDSLETLLVVGKPTEGGYQTVMLGFFSNGGFIHYHASPLYEIYEPTAWAFLPDSITERM